MAGHGYGAGQISFLDGTFSLIHIPLNVYHSLLVPILRILLPQAQTKMVPTHGTSEYQPAEATDTVRPPHPLPGLTSKHQPVFLNISITPLECSIVCHTWWTDQIFKPALAALPPAQRDKVSVSSDSYLVLSIISAGLDPAGRVIELTAPLALAGISVFFIATYYSDFILVPSRDRHNVIDALAAHHFAFCDGDSSFSTVYHHRPSSPSPPPPSLSPPPSPPSPLAGPIGRPIPGASLEHSLFGRPIAGHHRVAPFSHSYPGHDALNHLTRSRVSFADLSPARDHGDNITSTPSNPHNPETSAVDQMLARTFALLRNRHVVPYIGSDRRLVQCSGRDTQHHGPEFAPNRPSRPRPADHHPSWIDGIDGQLYAGIVSALLTRPDFLSITLTQEDPPSLLLDRALLALFGPSLVGDTSSEFVPLFLDLADLPFEATGIVCAVASRLTQGLPKTDMSQLSYISTARSGIVILCHDQAERALEVLRPLLPARA